MIQQTPKESLLQKQSVQQTTTSDTFDEQIRLYASWLSTQNQQAIEEMQRERQTYANRATQTVEVDGQRIQTFAPFRYKYSALQTITSKQSLTLTLLGLAYLLVCIWDWHFASLALLSIVTVVYFGYLLLDFVLAVGAMHQQSEEHIDNDIVQALVDADWPPYSILCPLYREAQVVPQFVKAMRALDYPSDKLQIMFLTEEDDNETREAIQALRLPHHFQIVTVPDGSPRTKPRACNYGLMEANGQYVVIYDAEDVPDPLQLKKAVLTFANYGTDLACVQAKLNFYNPRQNLLTRWFTAEYSLWFDLILPGLQRMRLAIPLGGTSNHFPTSTLRALGGWDSFNVTEDCDLGLRLSWFRLHTVVLNSVTFEEANSRSKNWIRQRSRWIKGYMQTYLVHMREPLHYFRQKRYREFFSLQFVVGGKTVFMLVNPLMWLWLLTSLGLRLASISIFSMPLPILIVGSISLFLGNFFYGYTYLLGCMKRQQYHLVKWMLLIPIYWCMASMAAYMALYQLFTKPHYWEKTIHGLHLQQSGEPLDLSPEVLLATAEDLSYVPLPSVLQDVLIHDEVRKYARLDIIPVESVANTLQEMIKPRKPAFSVAERIVLRQTHQLQRSDPWLLLTLFVASIASVAVCHFYYIQHALLLSKTAQQQIQLARDVITGTDLTLLGVQRLPLPQLAMLPFVWNNTLWHTGLAGSFQSMFCYVLSALCLFLLARRLTHDSRASFVASLLFILNPAILYVQSTPLNEMMLTATLLSTCYYLLAWVQEDRLSYLLCTSLCISLASLTSYVGWLLFIIVLCALPIIGLMKQQSREQTESTVVVFALPAVLGIFVWCLWCLFITRNVFAFVPTLLLHLPSQGQGAYHNLWQTLLLGLQDVVALVSIFFSVVAVLALLFFSIRERMRPVVIVILTLLVPLVGFLIGLFVGQTDISERISVIPFSSGLPFSLVEVVPAVAIFIACLIYSKRQTPRARLLSVFVQSICALLILAQSVSLAMGLHLF